MPWVKTTSRPGLAPSALGSVDALHAISFTSVMSQPSDLANVAASDSLPKSTSTYGMHSIIADLNGGTSMRKGAERFMVYVLPAAAACLATLSMESGETVRKKPAE